MSSLITVESLKSIDSIHAFTEGVAQLSTYAACQPNKTAALPRDVYAGVIPDFASAAKLVAQLRSFAQTQPNSELLLDAVEKAAALTGGLVVLRKPDTGVSSNAMFRRKGEVNEAANTATATSDDANKSHSATRRL